MNPDAPPWRHRREEKVRELCEALCESVDMKTLIASFYEEQFDYLTKEAGTMELLDFLVDYAIITTEEAAEIESNGW
jgi:hypothetical protein